MGRPVNKHFFGPSGIEVLAKVGAGAAKAGYIVKQTSTHEFIISVDGNKYTSNLVEKVPGDLRLGEMMIAVTMPGATSTVPAKTLKGHAVHAAGKMAVWATRTLNAAAAKIAKVGDAAAAKAAADKAAADKAAADKAAADAAAAQNPAPTPPAQPTGGQ